MPAGISYRVKRLIIEYLLPIVAQLTPIINTLAPDQQQCTTLVLLVDLVEVIDATISSVALCPSWGRAIGASGAVSAPQAEIFEIELQIASAARFRDDSSSCVRACSPAEMTPLCSMPCFSCSAASLRAALCELLSTRERHRASRSLAPRLARGTHESAMLARASRFLLKTFFPPLPLPGAAGFKNYGPAHQGRGVACTVLEPAL